MGKGFGPIDNNNRKPTGFPTGGWGNGSFEEKPPVKPVDSFNRELAKKNPRPKIQLDFSRIPVGAIVTVALIIAAGVLIWTYRDLISSFLITVLSWVLSVVLTIAVVVLILRLIFRPRRRGW